MNKAVNNQKNESLFTLNIFYELLSPPFQFQSFCHLSCVFFFCAVVFFSPPTKQNKNNRQFHFGADMGHHRHHAFRQQTQEGKSLHHFSMVYGKSITEKLDPFKRPQKGRTELWSFNAVAGPYVGVEVFV